MVSSEKKPLLSVIIPSFNQLDGLKNTYDHLSAENPDWMEIIISDGCSTDGSREWLLDSVDRIHKVRTSPDTGIYDGMNKGIEMASGKWVWFLGTGDLPSKEGLQTIKKAILLGDPSGLIAFGVHLLAPREPGVPENYSPLWGSAMKWRNTLHHQGVIYPLEILKTHRFDTRFKVLADYHLHLKLWKEGIQCKCIDTVVAEVGAGGVSRQFTKELYAEERAIKRDAIGGIISRAIQAIFTRGKHLWKVLCRISG
jgi:glycosyltransferase involved in cell wall biosynthesis